MSYRNPVRNVTVAQLASAPAIRTTVTNGDSNSGTVITLPTPVDCVKGDVMIMTLISTSSPTVDPNWTLLTSYTVDTSQLRIYKRPVVTADEGAGKTYSISGSQDSTAVAISAFGGVASPTASAVQWTPLSGTVNGSYQDMPVPAIGSPGIVVVIPAAAENAYPDAWTRWAPPAAGGPPTTPALEGGTLRGGGRTNSTSINLFGSQVSWTPAASYKLQMQRNSSRAGVATINLKPAA